MSPKNQDFLLRITGQLSNSGTLTLTRYCCLTCIHVQVCQSFQYWPVFSSQDLTVHLVDTRSTSFNVHLCESLILSSSCDPVDCSPPGSSVHGFSRQEHWSGLPFPSPWGLPHPWIEPRSLTLQAEPLLFELPGSTALLTYKALETGLFLPPY